MVRTHVLAALLLTVAMVPAVAEGQVIRGQLVDQTTGSPIRSAFVILLTDSTERARALTDRRGEFTLRAPGAGIYRLKSAAIGVKSVTSEPIFVDAGQELEYRFEIPAVLVVLPTVIIEDERVCRTRAEASLAAATLWQEARKALDAVVWTESQGVLRHRLVMYERELHPRSLKIDKDSTWSHTGFYRGSPFSTANAEELATLGYIHKVGANEYYYLGPDAGVLLSDQFAETHCFSMAGEGTGETLGMVGLRFTPVPGRPLPDIDGVLWVDAQTSELRNLEYRYTRLPYDVENARLGGQVEFERLPDGPWIVRRWWIRMPIVGIRQEPGLTAGPQEFYLHAILEDGGYVDQVTKPNGTAVPRGRGAVLVGSVYDSTTQAALGNARIYMEGSGYETRSDRNGRFRFDDMPEGTFDLNFSHPRLDSLAFAPRPLPVSLNQGQATAVSFWIPSEQTIWGQLCPSSDYEAGAGIVAGFVLDGATDEGVAGARVAVFGTRRVLLPGGTVQTDSIGGEAVTNDSGYYLVCDAPTDMSLTVDIGLDGVSMSAASIRLSRQQIQRLDLQVNRRRP